MSRSIDSSLTNDKQDAPLNNNIDCSRNCHIFLATRSDFHLRNIRLPDKEEEEGCDFY